MPYIADRVKETVTGTPGTGTITLGGASTGFQSFANGFPIKPCVVGYAITDGNAWEVGKGTLDASGATLTRDSLKASSTGAFLSLTSAAIVFCSASAELIDNANIGSVYAQSRGMTMP